MTRYVIWTLSFVLLPWPVLAQDSAEEAAHRKRLQEAAAASDRAWTAIEKYGRGVPRRVSPEEARSKALDRLSGPVVPRKPRRQARPRLTPAQEFEQLQNYREAILRRLRRLAPDRHPPARRPKRVEKEAMTLKFFDVQDLIVAPEDHSGPPVGLDVPEVGGGGAGAKKGMVLSFDDEEEDDHTAGVGIGPEKLLELLEHVTSEEGSLEISKGRLVVHKYPKDHARISAFLAKLRAGRAGMINLELRIYRMNSELYGSLRDQASALTEKGEALLAKAVKAGQASLLSRQKVIAHDGQKVNIHRGASRSIVATLDVNQTGVVPVINPFITVVHEGLNCDLRPVLNRARGELIIDLSLSRSRLKDPGEVRKIQDVEIELTQMNIARTTSTACIKLGRGALLGGVFSDGTERGSSACVVYVRARLLRGAGK